MPLRNLGKLLKKYDGLSVALLSARRFDEPRLRLIRRCMSVDRNLPTPVKGPGPNEIVQAQDLVLNIIPGWISLEWEIKLGAS